MNLKEILLEYDLVTDCLELDKYCDLIQKNLQTPKEKYKTQEHHVIPVSYYKKALDEKRSIELIRRAEKDVNNFKVNLLYKEHLLAHYYLAIAAKNIRFKYLNYNMLSFLQKNFNLMDLDKYQKLYEDCINYQNDAEHIERRRLGQKRRYQNESEEMKRKRLEKMKAAGLRRRGLKRAPVNETTRLKLSESLMNHEVSAETKAKISNTRKNMRFIAVSKNKELKFICSDALSEYLAEGWVKGYEDSLKTVTIKKDGITRRISKQEVEYYLEAGWALGHCHKTSQKLASYKTIHKDNMEKRIPKDELSSYLKDGWILGRAFKKPTQKVAQLDEDLNVVKIYDSIKEANQAVGLDAYSTSISICCKGRYKTAAGFRWKYIDKE